VLKRLLLFAETTGYQIRTFAAAARRAGAELTLATNRCRHLDDPWGDHAIAVKFDRIAESLEALGGIRCDGVAAVGDRPAVLAAHAAQLMGLPFHSAASAHACHDKFRSRSILQAAGLPVPLFFEARGAEDADSAPYPCVLKPIGLSASRGVIRTDNPAEFRAAYARIRRMGEDRVQVERYIPGREFAVEAIMTDGEFRPLAIFDKPDPLEGPFFEETIYTTPSRTAEHVQRELVEATAAAACALGLCHGPVHAELRHNSEGAWVLEAHARPIGGLCAKSLRFETAGNGAAIPLEELIARHALGEDVRGYQRESQAAGAMMIPIPRAGLYESVEGVDRARAVPGIEEVIITAEPGQRFVLPPEGSSYLGFLFARVDSPAAAEIALRRAHAGLRFRFATRLETLSPSI
jgi:biotin carboxylase